MANRRGVLALLLGGLGVMFLMARRAKPKPGTSYRGLRMEFGQAYPIAKLAGATLSCIVKFEYQGLADAIYVSWTLLQGVTAQTLSLLVDPTAALPAVETWTSRSKAISATSSILNTGLWDCEIRVSRYDPATAKVGVLLLSQKATGVYSFTAGTSYRTLETTFSRRR